MLCVTMTAAAVIVPRAAHAQTTSTSTTSMPATSLPGTASTAIGPGLSVKAARRGHLEGPVLVTGYLLVVPRRPIRLCDELTSARTARCAGASLEVRGLPSTERDALATAHRAHSSTRWSADPIQILGEVHHHTLRVEKHAQA